MSIIHFSHIECHLSATDEWQSIEHDIKQNKNYTMLCSSALVGTGEQDWICSRKEPSLDKLKKCFLWKTQSQCKKTKKPKEKQRKAVTNGSSRWSSRETPRRVSSISWMYMFLADSERQLPWRMSNLPKIAALAATEAPPDLRLCTPYTLFQNGSEFIILLFAC